MQVHEVQATTPIHRLDPDTLIIIFSILEFLQYELSQFFSTYFYYPAEGVCSWYIVTHACHYWRVVMTDRYGQNTPHRASCPAHRATDNKYHRSTFTCKQKFFILHYIKFK